MAPLQAPVRDPQPPAHASDQTNRASTAAAKNHAYHRNNNQRSSSIPQGDRGQSTRGPSHASSSGQPPSMSAGGQAASSTLGNPQPSSSGSGAATPAHQSGQVVLNYFRIIKNNLQSLPVANLSAENSPTILQYNSSWMASSATPSPSLITDPHRGPPTRHLLPRR